MKFPFWFSSVLHFHKTKTLTQLTTSMIAVGLYVFGIIIIEEKVFHMDFKPSSMLFSLLGLVLGLLLVFRTNTAYDRWWEGRKLLGALVNGTRNIAMNMNAFIPKTEKEDRAYLTALVADYCIAMKEHLRDGVIFEQLEDIDDQLKAELKKAKHVPNKITSLIIQRINELYTNGKLSKEQFLLLMKQLEIFADVVGACERIKNTPIPFSYSVHLKKFIFFYIMILPFGLIHELSYLAIPIMIMVFYAFTGLEVIGEEIEDPFGHDVNDLPTDKISKNINTNIKEIMNG